MLMVEAGEGDASARAVVERYLDIASGLIIGGRVWQRFGCTRDDFTRDTRKSTDAHLNGAGNVSR